MATDLLIQGRTTQQFVGEGSAWFTEMGVYKRKIDLSVSGTITTVYKGWAEYGTPEGSAGWRIQRIILDETSGLAMSDDTAGDGSFDQVWSDRASLTYS